MKTEEIKLAVKEAERFIKKAKECIDARSKTHGHGDYVFHADAPMQSGSARRASMDLTRQLAILRKP